MLKQMCFHAGSTCGTVERFSGSKTGSGLGFSLVEMSSISEGRTDRREFRLKRMCFHAVRACGTIERSCGGETGSGLGLRMLKGALVLSRALVKIREVVLETAPHVFLFVQKVTPKRS